MFNSSPLKYAAWLNERRLVAYPIIVLIAYAFLIAGWIFNASVLPDHKGMQFAHDFVNVYVSGEAVREGKAAEVYDWQKHEERQHQFEISGRGTRPWNGFVPWLYPPMFLAVAWLVSFLPYYTALACYFAAGFAACAFVLYKLAGFKQSKWAIAAFPGLLINPIFGNTGYITTSLLGAGLLFLDTSPVLAGFFFALLSYKPQFFVLIPLALAVGRYWKAFFSTCLSAAFLMALSLWAFGIDAWIGFFDGLPLARGFILESPRDYWLGTMHTVFSMVRIWGGSIKAAFVVQGAASVAAVASLLWIWRQRPLSLAVRGSVLCAVLILASPYSFVYDEILLAIPIALLAREGIVRGFLPYEKIFLLVLWLLPLKFHDMGEHYPFPLTLTPPLLVALIYLSWKRMTGELETNNYIAKSKKEMGCPPIRHDGICGNESKKNTVTPA